MAVIHPIRRDDDDEDMTVESGHGTYTPLMANLVTALIIIMLASLVLSGALFYLRWRRRRLAALRMQANLEANAAFDSSSARQMSQNASLRAPERPSHHRRNKSLTTPPHSPVFVVGDLDDKDSLMDEKHWEASRNGSVGSVPEIHLTFPEEMDEKTGKRESKVVVVTVTDKGGVGLQPYQDEPAPPYRERDNTPLKSLDLDRIGGLKEQRK